MYCTQFGCNIEGPHEHKTTGGTSSPPTENTPIPAKQGEGLAAAKLGFQIEMVAHGLSGAQTADSLQTAIDYATAAREDLMILCERVKALANLTEQDEAPPLDEWQPIETAPKDGTLVLIFDEKVDVYMASWINQSGLHPKPGWIDAEGDPCEPTHWKPLPQPPIGNLPNGGGDGE